jgi:aminomethyltransferase
MLGWTNERFIGRDAVRSQKDNGVQRRLVGFEMIDAGIARHGHRVMRNAIPVGVVTSGTQTPFLRKAIGMAYVPVELSRSGGEIEIEIRGRTARARVVAMPFYKRGRDVVSG